ncbi:hypothetical protein T4A_11420 [Trichinella pseudospiralis]|uniref:Uncharacterized protein n=1 Tax=Trichinella pseudospiralis TaxID=6337 RepID=A0A0V1DW55_TRIPS|nr:hypothetical protein T4A_11420 [Trichinella pseudospiralis]
MCNFQHWLEWTPNCADEASFWNVFRNKVTACGKSSSVKLGLKLIARTMEKSETENWLFDYRIRLHLKTTMNPKCHFQSCYGSRSCLSRKAVTCVIINNAAFGLIKESNGIKLSITNGVSRHETSNNLWQSAFFIKSAGVSWNDHKMVFQSGEPGCCNGAFLKCDANPFQISASNTFSLATGAPLIG